LLPLERAASVEHNDHLKEVLRTGLIGQRYELDDERRALYEAWLADEEVLAWQAFHEMSRERRESRIADSENPAKEFEEMFRGKLPPIHEYRVDFEMKETFDLNSLDPTEKSLVKKKIQERKKKLKQALKNGFEDDRRPLDDARRALFSKEVAEFDAEIFPETVPDIFRDGECNIFGHICPVFFAAETITETSTERRRGRYIPFAVKMRVVRRDNYTCQHCSKHLADDEVEFDHKIPISKGGSSEEQNVRLTCFDCNRDKSNKIEI
jgi:HNH endonuclease